MHCTIRLSLLLLLLLYLSLSLSFSLVTRVSVFSVWPSKRQVKRDMTSHYCEGQATPVTAARDFSRVQKPPRNNWTWLWFARGGFLEVQETRVKVRGREPIHQYGHAPSLEMEEPAFNASGKIDRQVEQMRACLYDTKITVKCTGKIAERERER